MRNELSRGPRLILAGLYNYRVAFLLGKLALVGVLHLTIFPEGTSLLREDVIVFWVLSIIVIFLINYFFDSGHFRKAIFDKRAVTFEHEPLLFWRKNIIRCIAYSDIEKIFWKRSCLVFELKNGKSIKMKTLGVRYSKIYTSFDVQEAPDDYYTKFKSSYICFQKEKSLREDFKKRFLDYIESVVFFLKL